MAKKNNNTDKLLELIWWLVTEMRDLKKEIEDIKKWKEVVELKDEPKVIEKQTPYKVMQVQEVRHDESYVDPALWWEFKLYNWLGKTFKSKKDALDYIERATKANPGIQFDIFPV